MNTRYTTTLELSREGCHITRSAVTSSANKDPLFEYKIYISTLFSSIRIDPDCIDALISTLTEVKNHYEQTNNNN